MLDYKIDLPKKHDYGIAIIGAGAIVNVATLPAYRKHQLNIVGIYDRVAQTAHLTANKFNLPRTYWSVEEIANDPRVDIVEIAVPPWEQPDIARPLMLAGKHLLCQKPLCDSTTRAKVLIKVAEVLGVKLAVNQQLRWAPSILAAHNLLHRGFVGKVQTVTFRIDVFTNWSQWSWLPQQERLEVLYHSIHYLDTMRDWFGEPRLVTSRHAHPDRGVKGESRVVTVLDYRDGPQVLIDDNHYSLYGAPEATFTIIGEQGVLRGTLGSMYNYPTGDADTLCYTGWRGSFEKVLEGSWIPDAFIGPMSSLMRAIQYDTEPETSGADNLKTLALVDACYASETQNRSIAV
jgi:predicted dehydrogenase